MGASVQLLLFQLIILVLQTIVAVASSNVIQPWCKDTCGNVSIPYPFGIGTGCFREGFKITCKEIDGSPQPVYGGNHSTLVAIDISLLQGQARVRKNLAWDCYNNSGFLLYQRSYLNLSGLPYTVSAARNKFTAIGCNTIAFIAGTNEHEYESGCMSFCNSLDSVSSDTCTGTGCCQTSIPQNLVYFNTTFNRRSYNYTGFQGLNPCSYAFVADQDWFKFDISYLQGKNFDDKYNDWVPLVLDWVVGDETCDEAMKNMTSYACRSSNSVCLHSTSGLGYICNCSQGYQGNPYLQGGCQDINECDNLDQYPCNGVCINTEGSYSCSCPPGTHSDDPKSRGCEPNPSPNKLPLWVKLALGFGIGIVCLLVLSFWIYMESEKRKLAREKERFFQQNGGLLLYEEMKSKRGATFKIYRKEELEKATNKFDKNLILGRGGHGTVYRGILQNNVTVAIKKSKTIDESQKEEFVKEILILSQINHTNVVKILGCCLEVEVPMLVYEFVSNGTLHDYIHEKNPRHPISLDTRLRIAIESAEALAYLHSAASPPILHGDVKSSNILLDDKYVAKVSDFGASILVAMDETQLATILQGTFGYLDPEYMQTYTFTDKSDVYSFGVVLLELLTRKKAVYFEGSEEQKNLASSFLSLMKEGRLTECLDDQLVSEGQVELLLEVSQLAKQCLSVKGEERPTMKEVVEELQRLIKFTQHPWEQHNPEELESLLGESSSYPVVDTSGYYSLEIRSVPNIDAGR